MILLAAACGERAATSHAPAPAEVPHFDLLPGAEVLSGDPLQIINLERIETLAPWPNDGYLVKLRGGLEVEMSRRQARLFHARARL